MTARITPGTVRETGVGPWLFSRLAGRVMGTEPPGVFTTLGRGRRLFWGWLLFAGGLMPGGKLPRRESELVILRVAHVRGSTYERDHHRRLGRRAGLTPAEIDRTGVDEIGDAWSARDALLLRSTDELLATRDLTDASFAALRAELDERRVVEFLLLVGHYDMLATTLSTLRIPVDRKRR